MKGGHLVGRRDPRLDNSARHLPTRQSAQIDWWVITRVHRDLRLILQDLPARFETGDEGHCASLLVMEVHQALSERIDDRLSFFLFLISSAVSLARHRIACRNDGVDLVDRDERRSNEAHDP